MLKQNDTRSNLRKLAECAIMLAAASILSLITVFKLPLGGSVTAVSMLPILVAGYRNGFKWGMVTAVAYAVMQILFDIAAFSGWGLTPAVFVGTLVLDYLLAYGVLGLSGLFRKQKFGYIYGTVVCLVLRFCMHLISGVVLFGSTGMEGYSAFGWSVVYNGSYMLPELIMTLIVMIILGRIPGILTPKEKN